MITHEKSFYTLIPLDEFKAVLGIDDRDDKLSRFCLVTSAYTIEQYCMRRLLCKKHFERIGYFGDLLLPLREYPVNEILAVHTVQEYKVSVELLEPAFYDLLPDCGTYEDIPIYIELSPALRTYKNLLAVKIIYKAGYSLADVPADLKAACLELAAWNFNRYKRKAAMSNYQGAKDKEHIELSMPENVKFLLEPYRRKTI